MRTSAFVLAALLLTTLLMATAPTAVAPGCENFAPPFDDACRDPAGWTRDTVVGTGLCFYNTAPRDWADCLDWL